MLNDKLKNIYRPEKDDKIVVSVFDSGQGISKEKRQNIFDKKCRKNGLFICKRIVEDFDG
jgi:K+-sensing histidine kinase KdpD